MSRTDPRLTAPLDKGDIEKMRKVCKLAARTLEHVAKFIKPGITTNEIDQIVVDFTKSHGATNGPLGYHGFPKSICTSINEVVCHGLPDGTILKDGDIINVDVTPVLDGFFGDSSATFCVPRTLFVIASGTFASINGTCLWAAAWNTTCGACLSKML